MIDNRTHKRASITLHLKLKESDTDMSINFKLKDLSEGGIFIHSSLLWEPGEQFDLSFYLPGIEKEITVVGEVARAEDRFFLANSSDSEDPTPGMGIKFIDISDEDRNLIKNFITSYEKTYSSSF